MATPWIKLEMTTPDKPEVSVIAARLRIDPDAVVGKLVRLWTWADANTASGEAVAVTDEFIDRMTHRKGFAAAMRAAGWLCGPSGEITFPGFTRHNGESAKARSQAATRMEKHRSRNAASVTEALQEPPDCNAASVTKPLPDKNKNKNKEETPFIPLAQQPDPAAIAAAYPRRERCAEAIQEIARQIKAGADPDAIMAGTRAAAAEIMSQPGGHLNAYVPSALSFFRDRRWADDPAAMFRNQGNRANGAPTSKLDLGGRRAASETLID